MYTHVFNPLQTQKVLVIFQSMWGSTARMAAVVIQQLRELNIPAKMIDVKLMGLQQIAEEAVGCSGFAFGSPTLNFGAMPGIVGTINYLRGLKLVDGRRAIVFGSHGWGEGEGVKWVHNKLEDVGIEVIGRIDWKFNF